jgi:hypothetical protein
MNKNNRFEKINNVIVDIQEIVAIKLHTYSVNFITIYMRNGETVILEETDGFDEIFDVLWNLLKKI